MVSAVAAGWLVVLNVVTAAGALPYALHGQAVMVVIRRCQEGGDGIRTCRGDYRLADRTQSNEVVLGADSARVGATMRATVDGRHPGAATVADAFSGVVEALVFALAGLVVMAAALRAAVRARRRRGQGRSTAAPGVMPIADRSGGAAPVPEDPLAWVRPRRFGAGDRD